MSYDKATLRQIVFDVLDLYQRYAQSLKQALVQNRHVLKVHVLLARLAGYTNGPQPE